MGHILELLVNLTITGSAAVCCILLLRFISPHTFSARWRYAVGKIAIWFYIFPIALIMNWLLPYLTPKPVLDLITPGMYMSRQETSTGSMATLNPVETISTELAWVLLSLWGIGALTFAIWQVYCYLKFMKKMKETRLPVSMDSEAAEQLASLKQVLGIRGDIKLCYSPNVKSPVLLGLLKPTILLPLSDKLEMDIDMVIRHELVHLKRRDLWTKMIILGVGTLHWFNPFVHLLRKYIHIWSELSCDEEVVKEMSFADRKRYGQTILNVMIGTRDLPVRFCASLSGDGKLLKRRLMMILDVKKLKKHTKLMIAATIFLIGAIGTSTAVWAANSTPKVETFIAERYTIEEKGGSSFSDGSEYDYAFTALTSEQQKRVTKEMAHYYLDEQGNVVDGSNSDMIPFESLTAEQQLQATKEIGWYSLKMVREMND